MSDLTEQEIFDRLSTSFKLAAECCVDLAERPSNLNANYSTLIYHLKLIEGAARQAAYWREDTRWLPTASMIAKCHEMAGRWLRGHYARKNFTKLAENLMAGHAAAEMLRTQKTGRLSGPILPETQPAPHRETRPTQVLLPPSMMQRSSGLIMPAHATAQ